jgi:hypothetical protein
LILKKIQILGTSSCLIWNFSNTQAQQFFDFEAFQIHRPNGSFDSETSQIIGTGGY